MKTLKFSDYIEIRKPHYIYIKITSHKSIRNFNSTQIAKMIALTYKRLNKKLYKEQKKFIIETNFKISYVIDIVGNNANFYFIVPILLKNQLLEKINEIWSKATVEEVDNPFSDIKQESIYEVRTVKEDALSLYHDKKTNDPLNYILSCMDIMKSEDRVTIVTNFMPQSQFGWEEQYQDTMDKVKKGKALEKANFSINYIFKTVFLGLVNILDEIAKVLSDFTGVEADNKESLYASVIGILEEQRSLSNNTKNKRQALVIPTQIAVCSNKEELTRGCCQAYKVLDEDNEITYKQLNNREINILDYDLSISKNMFSVDEISNFIKIPGRALLMQHKINHINVQENKIPSELKNGIKRLGVVTVKGTKENAYFEDEYNNGNLPLVSIGSQGSGKTTYIANYAYDCSQAKEGLILIDIIKNTELSEDIKNVVPADRVIDIDLGSESGIQGLGYNEIEIKDTDDSFTKLKLASLQAQQIMSLVDSVSVGDPLSSRMRRFLNAAAQVVFVQGYTSIKNVIECLEDHKKRNKYIYNLDEEITVLLEDEINTLCELDEWSKGTKATKDKEATEPSIVGTNSGKIEHILDRVGMLREDFKLKYMYNKSLSDNINLVNAMEEGKIVLIRMRENDFPTKMQKNILVTYWVSKIWLASQLRGMLHSKPLRCNIIIDEVFQAPTCMDTLEYILPQSRKFGSKFIFSTQYMKQLDKIFDTLEASGSGFMMLTGSTENDFNHFKSKLDEFEYEDLRDMPKYHSLNLIKYSNGYASFITKLPPALNNA